MKLRRLAFLPPIALAMMLASCDSRDYEAELAALQSDLESARSELQTAQSDNERLTGEMDELRAQSEQAGGMDEEASAAVQSELNTIIENASATLANLSQVEAQAEGADVGGVRENVEQIIQAAQATAQELGLEVQEGQPEPAAGPADQQPDPAAGAEGEEQPEPAAGPAEQEGEDPAAAEEDQPEPAAGPAGQEGQEEPGEAEGPVQQQQ